MSFLTHEHIVASQDVQGYILINKTTGQCRADLFVSLGKLNVDDPQLRAEAELNTTSSLRSIANTKENMLKSIDAADFPFAQLHSSDCSEALSGKDTKVELTIHGVQQDRQLAIRMQPPQDEQLIIRRELSILQTEFGIEPFSIFSGLIEVEDKLDLTYKLVFTEITTNAATNR